MTPEATAAIVGMEAKNGFFFILGMLDARAKNECDTDIKPDISVDDVQKFLNEPPIYKWLIKRPPLLFK